MFTRLNISLPEETVNKIRKIVPKRGLSRFLDEAARDRLKQIELEKALKELLAAPPAFPQIKNSSKWVRELRRRDLKRFSNA